MVSTRPAASTRATLLAVLVSGQIGCTVDVYAILPGRPEVGDEAEDGEEDSGESGDSLGDGDSLGGALLDLPETEDSFPQQACTVAEGQLDAALPCEQPRRIDRIEPTIEWAWTGPSGEDSVLVTPLVANLDDDDGSGSIDLCDSPDVLVVATGPSSSKSAPLPHGYIHVLDGATGLAQRRFAQPVHPAITPAIADLDGDGSPEIISLQAQAEVPAAQLVPHRLVVFDSEGEVRWFGPFGPPQRTGGAVAVADLDADGSPEILAPGFIASAEGQVLWQFEPGYDVTPLAVDLDLDGELEVMIGASAYTAAGTLLFTPPGIPDNEGSAAIANFDDDPFPEIYVQRSNHRILEHDGSIKANCPGGAGFPVAIDDFDGDGLVEILYSQNEWVRVLAVVGDACSVAWSSKIDEIDARSSGTAFDLLGDGEAEILYADRSALRIFSAEGEPLFEFPRRARTTIANPVVADIDNDAAADILVVNSQPLDGDPGASLEPVPSLIVLRNSDDAFAPTRRIWNQHTYHGTNIAEDASVPVQEPPHWLQERGFRTNAAPATVNSAVCQGEPVLP